MRQKKTQKKFRKKINIGCHLTVSATSKGMEAYKFEKKTRIKKVFRILENLSGKKTRIFYFLGA